ncbi:tRNA (adenosine(37)-N6)-threonylcarbamoyltransferase complex ATPase subunit type 1 TsaE [Arthrobacter sp. TMN-37]
MTEPVQQWLRSRSVSSAGELQAVAEELGPALKGGDLLILTGGLGAGKTTFTQGLGRGLGVRGAVISPTFILVRNHPSLSSGPALVHVDAYRLESAEELDDLDLEATLDSSVTVVEWGAGRAEHLSDSRLEITITRPTGGDPVGGPGITTDFSDDADEERELRVAGFGPRWSSGPPAGLLD